MRWEKGKRKWGRFRSKELRWRMRRREEEANFENDDVITPEIQQQRNGAFTLVFFTLFIQTYVHMTTLTHARTHKIKFVGGLIFILFIYSTPRSGT